MQRFNLKKRLLIEETNAAEHYERTKFDLYKDDICLSDIISRS